LELKSHERQMNDPVKIVECPRDAWQALPVPIPAEIKAAYLGQLIQAGFSPIDAVSFVSPAAVPQMADSERVLEQLAAPANTDIIGIVVNEKGAERAIGTGTVRTLGFPYSISPEFLQRNQRQTPEQAIGVLQAIVARARDSGLNVAAYLSMAFGNPYRDPWSIASVLAAIELLVASGVRQISLADTVGIATPAQIVQTLRPAIAGFQEIEIGVHLHARRDQAAARVCAAFEAGCRRFDAAIGGLGGCPFAQDRLVGNIPTEILIETLTERGAELPALAPLDALIRANAEIAAKFGASQHEQTAH
jgi:hydroxymethylglutaryl-CoA lyase